MRGLPTIHAKSWICYPDLTPLTICPRSSQLARYYVDIFLLGGVNSQVTGDIFMALCIYVFLQCMYVSGNLFLLKNKSEKNKNNNYKNNNNYNSSNNNINNNINNKTIMGK